MHEIRINMLKYFSRFIIKIFGWRITPIPEIEDKCVIIAGPHTSMWDFLLAWLFFTSIGVRSRYLIKKEIFFFPLGLIIKAMGGIPVDRSPGNDMVNKVAIRFRNSKSLQLTITPEGTRKKVKNWKKGFIYIAKRANGPIYAGYVDYAKKEMGFITKFTPTDDIKADMKYIQSLYKGYTAKHPERFSTGQ